MWGERISHLCPNDCYYAHLSIYRFVEPFCRNATVLDAGAGSGYGSDYLAGHSAEVCGVDGDPEAIASCSRQFQRPNLRFQVQDLRRLSGFPDSSFDVIVASNSLEHVAGVESFFRCSCRLLKPGGVLISAVPAARTRKALAEELGNLHHVNIWSPAHWYRVHCRYFAEVRCHAHLLSRQGAVLDPNRRPEDTVIRETDFDFPEETPEGLYRPDTHTAIFVCRNQVPEAELPAIGSTEPILDHSVSRRSYPAWVQPLLWAYYRVTYVVRYEGIGTAFRKAAGKLSRRST